MQHIWLPSWSRSTLLPVARPCACRHARRCLTYWPLTQSLLQVQQHNRVLLSQVRRMQEGGEPAASSSSGGPPARRGPADEPTKLLHAAQDTIKLLEAQVSQSLRWHSTLAALNFQAGRRGLRLLAGQLESRIDDGIPCADSPASMLCLQASHHLLCASSLHVCYQCHCCVRRSWLQVYWGLPGRLMELCFTLT